MLLAKSLAKTLRARNWTNVQISGPSLSVSVARNCADPFSWFSGPEIDRMCQYLWPEIVLTHFHDFGPRNWQNVSVSGPEILKMDQHCCLPQKLTLWAKDSLCNIPLFFLDFYWYFMFNSATSFKRGQYDRLTCLSIIKFVQNF